MPAFAFARIRRGEAMPGMFVASQQAALARLIEDIVLVAECANVAEYDGRIVYLPLN